MGYISIIRSVCKLSALSMLFLFVSATSALANNPPGPMGVQAEVGLIMAFAGCSLLSGYYDILNRQRKSKKIFSGVTVTLGVLAFLWSFTHEGAVLVVTTILSGVAIVRSLKMFFWGAQRQSKDWPDYLQDAVPWRLFIAGTVLIVSAIFFCGIPFAFHSMTIGHGPGKIQKEHRLERFNKVVTYQIAYGQLAEQESGLIRFHNPSGQEPYPQRVQDEYSADKFFRLQLEIDQVNKKFSAYLPPSLPFFPYNYLTSFPAYRGDETGAIQMIRVQDKLSKFPENAPIVRRISANEIEEMKQEILEARKQESEKD